MKAYIMTDLEGVSGIISFEEQCSKSGKYYEAPTKKLICEPFLIERKSVSDIRK